MSVGYQSPGPAFSGPDAGECRSNAAFVINATTDKTVVGQTADGRKMYALTSDLEWSDVEWDTRQGGSVPVARHLEAGSVVAQDGRNPGVWVEYSTSAEHGYYAGHNPRPELHLQILALVPETSAARQRRRIEAAFAAGAVLDSYGVPEDWDDESWFSVLCRVAAGETDGMAGGKHSAKEEARAALNAAATPKKAEEPAVINNPFAALAALKGAVA
jgi:hypothetical protein